MQSEAVIRKLLPNRKYEMHIVFTTHWGLIHYYGDNQKEAQSEIILTQAEVADRTLISESEVEER